MVRSAPKEQVCFSEDTRNIADFADGGRWCQNSQFRPDQSKEVLSVDVYYTQHGLAEETPRDRERTKHRFWHHADAPESDGTWSAKLPIADAKQPLWVYANVLYSLELPVVGAGYYYSTYTADSFNLSSNLHIVSPEELASAKIKATLKPALTIENFNAGWEKEWFTYKPQEWARATNKLYHESYTPPKNASLGLEVLSDESNSLVILLDEWATEVSLEGGNEWQKIVLKAKDFHNCEGEALPSFDGIMQLKLSPRERLRPQRGTNSQPRVVGANWRGTSPTFRNLRWVPPRRKLECHLNR